MKEISYEKILGIILFSSLDRRSQNENPVLDPLTQHMITDLHLHED